MGKSSIHTSTQPSVKNSLQVKLSVLNIVSSAIICIILIAAMLLFQNWVTVIICGIVMVVIINIISFFMISKITSRINTIKDRITAMAVKCDYTSEVPYFESNDELQQLCQSVQQLKQVQICHMRDIVGILNKIADNDLNVTVDCEYPGDFQPQKIAIQRIINKLNQSVGYINNSVSEISTATESVAQGVQVVTSGTISQASAIDKLSNVMKELYDQTKQNARDAAQATKISSTAGEVMTNELKKVKELLKAMHDINDTSQKISKVIKAVDDIAFQTNILALNASVEAARAGVAGKGFAVVAEEVRNLANKSAEASKGTAGLIQNAVHAVENGTKIAQEMAQVFDKVMNKAKEATNLTTNIADAIYIQEEAMQQATAEIEQINQVIQTNSAIAQEGNASSEELAGQAQQLKNMVSQFKFQKKTTAY